MPSTVVDFTHANGAPGGITPPSYAGTGTAPTARTLSAALGAPDNGAPAGITPPSYAGTAAEPTARALAAMAGTEAAPGGIVPPSYAGTGDAPTARDLPMATTPTEAAPAGIAPPSYAGTGSAPGAVAGPDLTGTASTPAARALPAATVPTANVPQTVGYAPSLSTPTDDTMHTPSLPFAGRLTAGQLFGFYKPTVAVAVRGVQLAIQDPATGADVIVELCDSDGTGLGRTATLPAGAAFADVTFGTPLPLAVGTLLRAKVTQVGSTKAGSFLTANLIVQVA